MVQQSTLNSHADHEDFQLIIFLFHSGMRITLVFFTLTFIPNYPGYGSLKNLSLVSTRAMVSTMCSYSNLKFSTLKFHSSYFLLQSASCSLVSGLRECPLLIVNRDVKYKMALRLRMNIFTPLRRTFATAVEEESHEGNLLI